VKRRGLSAISIFLLVSGIPALGNSGPKNWFHRKHGSSSHYQANHIMKRHTAKHPKPHYIRNPHN
jgi:hypothetical protein